MRHGAYLATDDQPEGYCLTCQAPKPLDTVSHEKTLLVPYNGPGGGAGNPLLKLMLAGRMQPLTLECMYGNDVYKFLESYVQD